MRIGLVQLCSGTNVTENIRATSELIRECAGHGAKLITTPEMTHLVQKDKKNLWTSIAPENLDGGVSAFSALAKELSITLLVGSLAIRVGDKIANRCYVFSPNGIIQARYDKIHLFDAQVSDTESYRESATYIAGDKTVICDVEQAKIGLSICYDLRFPALYRHYAQSGANILSIPAAFTVPTGQSHWDVLLRARAIETGSFVVAAAQGGQHEDGRSTYGHSKIINPWGDVLAELAHDKPDYLWADINLNEVDKFRRRIPAWTHDVSWQIS